MLSPTTVNPLPDPMEQVDLSHPITEDDIANFLLASPDFFVRHAEVLASVQLASPHGNRAVGLQQRQAEMLREKIKGLEARIVDMVGHAHDNAQLADKVEQLCCELLHVEEADELPQRLLSELAQRFDMPQVALRLWDVDARFADAPFAQDVDDDARAFAASLDRPFCGVNPGLPIVHWLPEPTEAMSLALIPLRWPGSAPSAAATAPDSAGFRHDVETAAAAAADASRCARRSGWLRRLGTARADVRAWPSGARCTGTAGRCGVGRSASQAADRRSARACIAGPETVSP